MKKFLFFLGLIIIFVANLSEATELIFQFTNPNFGGNSLNGNFLLNQAQLQNKFKEPVEEPSIMEQLQTIYQAQYLNKILEDIYTGKDVTPGEYIIGNLKVNVTKGTDMYTINVLDTSTGQTTTFQLPIIP